MMKSDPSEITLTRYWPLVVCLVAVLISPLLLIPRAPQLTAENREELILVGSPSPEIARNENNRFETTSSPAPRVETASEAQSETAEKSSPEPVPEVAEPDRAAVNTGGTEADLAGTEPSELEKRTADWRYVGLLAAGERSIAVIERMKFPEKKFQVPLGDTLEGVSIDTITSASIQVVLEGESREIPLTQGPAFDVEDLLIPDEVLDDPEILTAVVFAQTLGKFVAGEPDFSTAMTEVEPGEESMREMMDALAAFGNLIPPMQGESVEDWAAAAAGELSDDGGAAESGESSDQTLSEETRISLLGFDRLMNQ